jgi:peptide/nickel transport system permease protein
MGSKFYIGMRLVQMLPTMILLTVLVFLLVHLLPGDPALALLGNRATEENIADLRLRLGLDRSIFEQFVIYFGNLATGDLGQSIIARVPVSKLIAERLPVTLLLTAYAGILAALIAIPLALVAALNRGSKLDIVIRMVFQVGLSMPVFYVGLIFLIVFAAKLGWFPVGGYGSNLAQNLYYLFLPALTLAYSFSAIIMRSLRASIIEVLNAEYVTFARAKGLPRALILRRHVLRNAAIATVNLFGYHIGTLVSGAVITESVFGIPGAGRLMVDSIYARDYPVVQSLTLVLALAVSLVFLVVDLILAALDPKLAHD